MQLYGALGSHYVARARTIERIFDQYVAPEASALFRNLDPATRDPAVAAAAQTAFAIFRKTFVPLLGVPDPTQSDGKLKSWWQAMTEHPVTGPFLREYDLAVDALLASFRQR